MKDICIAEANIPGKTRDLSYSLIWGAMWIVALMALLLLPALGH